MLWPAADVKGGRRSTDWRGSAALRGSLFLNRAHVYDFRGHWRDMQEPKTGQKIHTEYYGISTLEYKKD